LFCYGRTARRRSGQGSIADGSLAVGGRSVLFLVFDLMFCSFSSVLAEKRLAEVGQIVSQGAPHRHALDFVEATYGQRPQATIRS
jgi:hypothetical protein